MRALVNEDRINGPEAQRIIVWTCRNSRWKLFGVYLQCTLLMGKAATMFNLRWSALHSDGERAMSKRSVWIAGGPVRGEKEAHF